MKSPENANARWKHVDVGRFRGSRMFLGRADPRVRNEVGCRMSQPPFGCLHFALAFWVLHALDFPRCPVCWTPPLGKPGAHWCSSVHTPAAAWRRRGTRRGVLSAPRAGFQPLLGYWDRHPLPHAAARASPRGKQMCSWVKWGSAFQIMSVSDTFSLGFLVIEECLKWTKVML